MSDAKATQSPTLWGRQRPGTINIFFLPFLAFTFLLTFAMYWPWVGLVHQPPNAKPVALPTELSSCKCWLGTRLTLHSHSHKCTQTGWQLLHVCVQRESWGSVVLEWFGSINHCYPRSGCQSAQLKTNAKSTVHYLHSFLNYKVLMSWLTRQIHFIFKHHQQKHTIVGSITFFISVVNMQHINCMCVQ